MKNNLIEFAKRKTVTTAHSYIPKYQDTLHYRLQRVFNVIFQN